MRDLVGPAAPFDIGQPMPQWPGGVKRFMRTMDATYVAAADETYRYIDYTRVLGDKGQPLSVVNRAQAETVMEKVLTDKNTQTGALVVDIGPYASYQREDLIGATRTLLGKPEYASFERVLFWDNKARKWVADIERALTPSKVEMRLRMALLLMAGAAIRDMAAPER